MSNDTHPFTEEHNYRVTVDVTDGETFDVIAAVVNDNGDGTGSIHGIQPHNYPDFPNGLFWASGSLGGPRGDARRGLYPSVTINDDDPLEITAVEPADEEIVSER